MDFFNDTELQADVFRAAPWEDEILAMVVAKATFRVAENGEVNQDDDPIAVLREPMETPFGILPADIAPQKSGVDLLVLGQAHAPGGKPTDKMPVALQVGGFKCTFAVVGDRVWKKDKLGISPTPPKPFLTMPVIHENAYGGNALLKNKEVPNGYNPLGKGYILDKAEADGVPLPNIEDPQDIVTSWESQPLPAGFAPIPLGTQITAERGIAVDQETKQPTVKPEFYNCAHPKMVIQELRSGEEVVLSGMTPDGEFKFNVPQISLSALLSLEDELFPHPMRVDTLCILPEERRFFIILRAGFKYRFIPEQIRVIRVQHVSERKK
jgi:hypothetical protein